MYDDVLKRLKEERVRLSWSQREMSQCVRMSQSNYSKVELGLRRLNFHELKYLCESDVDVHYIYTAHKSTGQYLDLFKQCSYSELTCFMGIIYSVALLRYKEEATESWKCIWEKVKYIPLIEGNKGTDNIFLIARRSINCQQKKMADILGVDVKKLRDLENGRNLPDSELLCRLYELFQIPPAAILKDKKCLVNEISILIDMMDIRSRELIFDLIKKIHDVKIDVKCGDMIIEKSTYFRR